VEEQLKDTYRYSGFIFVQEVTLDVYEPLGYRTDIPCHRISRTETALKPMLFISSRFLELRLIKTENLKVEFAYVSISSLFYYVTSSTENY
jgi:hypothetical protein